MLQAGGRHKAANASMPTSPRPSDAGTEHGEAVQAALKWSQVPVGPHVVPWAVQAMAAYRAAARRFPGLHQPLLGIGMEYARMNNLNLALQCLQNAHDLAPTCALPAQLMLSLNPRPNIAAPCSALREAGAQAWPGAYLLMCFVISMVHAKLVPLRWSLSRDARWAYPALSD